MLAEHESSATGVELYCESAPGRMLSGRESL
ncbi:hypothetical protein Mal15_52150 [Stieleria maiorica]|uniref:Uncharacterized protein n=1 Tax=Stieleria maiorica TaxID=2795974 RepID=A0A5B9MIV6_9BACT|nr:hypothetical protein Mal15_52150 [Stieleria maiorica]